MRGEPGRATLGGVMDLRPPLGPSLEGASWAGHSMRE